MAQAKRRSPGARRTPRQQRSVQAVESIFEATARLIESQGLETLTTARIAEVAGYGVGTVYDYFPTKNAILIAMARQELDKTLAAVQRALRHTDAEGPATATQRAMRAMIRGFGGRRRLRGALLSTMMAQGHSSELTRPVEMIGDFLSRQEIAVDGADMRGMLPERLYVLTRAIVGVIRAWAMEGGGDLSAQTLEIELTELVRGYVQHRLCGLGASAETRRAAGSERNPSESGSTHSDLLGGGLFESATPNKSIVYTSLKRLQSAAQSDFPNPNPRRIIRRSSFWRSAAQIGCPAMKSSSDQEKIAFVGLGKMGAAMAANVRRAGHPLVVWNRSSDKASPLLELGARLAKTPAAAAADAEIVISSLADDDAVRAVVSGTDGVLAGMRPGAVHVGTSTISPTLSEELGRDACRSRAPLYRRSGRWPGPRRRGGAIDDLCRGRR